MRCIGRYYRLFLMIVFCAFLSSGCEQAKDAITGLESVKDVIARFNKTEEVIAGYEAERYNREVFRGKLFAEDLCVSSQNIVLEREPDTSSVYAMGLFDIGGQKVDCAYQIHDRLFPASTTKIMTALLAIKYADLSSVVTVSADADAAAFAFDEKTCGLKAGDQLTLLDLLHGLLMESGNDAAVAIAEHVAGSSGSFAQLMNDEAYRLMATNTHFVNSNGLHADDHYTTAYDLYLIFNECIQYDQFVNIIGTNQYTVQITGADGQIRQLDWKQTNCYATGEAQLPADAVIVGGKTGTTQEAGNCLILLEKDWKDSPYISIVMGAQSRALLYQDMTALIDGIPENE